MEEFRSNDDRILLVSYGDPSVLMESATENPDATPTHLLFLKYGLGRGSGPCSEPAQAPWTNAAMEASLGAQSGTRATSLVRAGTYDEFGNPQRGSGCVEVQGQRYHLQPRAQPKNRDEEVNVMYTHGIPKQESMTNMQKPSVHRQVAAARTRRRHSCTSLTTRSQAAGREVSVDKSPEGSISRGDSQRNSLAPDTKDSTEALIERESELREQLRQVVQTRHELEGGQVSIGSRDSSSARVHYLGSGGSAPVPRPVSACPRVGRPPATSLAHADPVHQPLVRPSSAHEARPGSCAIASPSSHCNHHSEPLHRAAAATSHPAVTCNIPQPVIEQRTKPKVSQLSAAFQHSRIRPQSAGPVSSTLARVVGACSSQCNPKQVALPSHHVFPLARPASARGSRGTACIGTSVVETGAAAVSGNMRLQKDSVRCAMELSDTSIASAETSNTFSTPRLPSSKKIPPRFRMPSRPMISHPGSKQQPVIGGGSRPEYIPKPQNSADHVCKFRVPHQGNVRWDSQADVRDVAGRGLDHHQMLRSEEAPTTNCMLSMDTMNTFASSHSRSPGLGVMSSKSKGSIQVASAKNNMQNMRVALKTGHSQPGRPRTPTVAERIARRRSGSGQA